MQGELGELLNDIGNGSIIAGDIIIVVRALDRLSRQKLTGAINTYNTIMMAGVFIHTTMDNTLYKPDDQLSLFMATLAFNTASEESLKKGMLTNKYAQFRIEQFQRGDIPDNGSAWDIGVARHPFYITIEGRVIKPHPIYFNAMKQAVKLTLSGYGIIKIQQFFNENYQFFDKDGKEYQLSYSTIGKTFRSESLFGRRTVKLSGTEYILDNYYPALITESEFFQIRAIKESRTVANGNRKRISVLAGHRKTYCACCGASVIALSIKKQHYYRCGYKHCFTSIRQAVLDKIILKNITSHKFQVSAVDYTVLNGLEEQHKNAESILDQNRSVILDNIDLFGDSGKIKLEKLQNNCVELEIKIEVEKQRIFQQDADQKSVERSEKLRDSIIEWKDKIDEIITNGSDVDREEMREVVQQFVKKITVDGNLIKIELVDGSVKYSYLLKSKMANPRIRYYIDLNVKSEEEYEYFYRQMVDDEMGVKLFKAFTTLGLLDNYSCFDDELDREMVTLATPQSEIVDYKQRFVDKVFNSVPWKTIVWDRKSVMKTGITTTQWQDYKNIDLTEFGNVYEVKYKTPNYTKKSAKVVSRIEDNDELMANLKLILNAHKIETATEIIPPSFNEYFNK